MSQVSEDLEELRRILRRLDPNDDPTAEPLGLLPVAVLFLVTAFSTWMFLRWKIQPMQDVGHHLAMTSVVTDYSREGSLYPALYKPFDFLNTNSLLYTVAGYSGKLIGASWAFRIAMASYVAGVPLANLYALRVFGRSPWGAVIAVPLVYNISFVYGFANFLFAAPFAVMSIPLFYRMLVKPSWQRIAWAAACVTFLFLAHVHVFLWTGVMLFLMTLVGFVVACGVWILGRPGPNPLKLAGASLLSVGPSLMLVARWYYKSTQPQPEDEYALFTVGDTGWEAFKAALKLPTALLTDFWLYVDLSREVEDDTWFVIGLGIALFVCAGVARLHKWKRPPVMEIACALTVASYFLIPEHAMGQAVIGSRQIGFAMWLAPAFFTPVPGAVTRVGRYAVIALTLYLSYYQLRWWHKLLVEFQTEEAMGLTEVIKAAPPRKRLHYVNIEPSSKYFILKPFWHMEKWYMIDKAGQCNENPAYGRMNSIHYRKTFEPHRVTHHANDWPSVNEIWNHYDLVLVHNWAPTPADLAKAQLRGELIKKRGKWEIWRSKGQVPPPEPPPAPAPAPAPVDGGADASVDAAVAADAGVAADAAADASADAAAPAGLHRTRHRPAPSANP